MVNAMTENDFEEIELFGEPALFTCLRIDPNTVPMGVYKYDIRHDDECQGIACEIAKFIFVNHWGSVLTLRPIDLGKDGFLLMSDDDINYGIDSGLSLKKFIQRHIGVS